MINNVETVPATPVRRTANRSMLLHCGATLVSREQLFDVPTPERTSTWYPLGHRVILEEVEAQLTSSGFSITDEAHALSHNNNRYFGVLAIRFPGAEAEDFGWVVGLRNSHDKTYPAGLVAGTRVFVCDNLAFSGEIRISRKHTRYAERDLRHLTARAVGQLSERFKSLDDRIASYKKQQIDDCRAHDIVVRAVDCQAITTTQLPDVLALWRKPIYEEFAPRTAWSLFNAFTEMYKQINPYTAMKRGEALFGLFDSVVSVLN